MTTSTDNPNPTNDALIAALIDANPDFANTLLRSRAATTAIDAIHALDDHADDETLDAMRNILTDDIDDLMTLDPDHLSLDHDAFNRARDLLQPILIDIRDTDYESNSRHALTLLALEFSLCPMHFCDYAICFDDDDDECATIRRYLPNHDT